jgi:glycosyltransferase involved in cell wall biosynthesis
MISVIILTQDEASNLPDCLATLAWCVDIHVVDSGSTDRTVEIARRHGCRVLDHPFASFAEQRNWALDHCRVQHDWVLFLDADERCTEAFRTALLDAVAGAGSEAAGFYCCWKLMLMGRWLKRSGFYPNWQFRLVRGGRARFRDYGHGQKEGEVDGVIGYIEEPFLHLAFSKGWDAWVERHNRYSSQEAKARLREPVPFQQMFDRRPTLRNFALRCWLTRLPGWPLLRFVHVYLFRLGFLEGYPGLVQAVNVAWYEYLIKLKINEQRRRDRKLPV